MNIDFRKGIGRHWWIEFDVNDVEERMDLTQSGISQGYLPGRAKRSLYRLRIMEFTALILILVFIKEKEMCFERVGIVRHWQKAKWSWFHEVTAKIEIYLM